MAEHKQIQLHGRVFVGFTVETVTGLHIGGSEAGIEIGGVDKTVIRDPLTNRPYIPGSSLKGKMRSLLEKYEGKVQNQRIGQGFIHSCTDAGEYTTCAICQVFGVPGERDFSLPTRLVVRDVHLDKEEADRITKQARTDLPYTEVKTEVSIDRVTSAANPRQMERVPAGTRFGPAELVYSIYGGDGCDPAADTARLETLATGLQLLEDDYLGGLGSRGSGRVRFTNFQLTLRSRTRYLAPLVEVGDYPTLADLVANLAQVQDAIRQQLAL
ncbi:MAG TPA: type III-A CRISPR-associated RAMP protein Csm3 [Caldilineaceae bacterium]|nr:type III-A CRISPR-associated RAMP protein Csm3 [Caldilineaceae bacterium]